MSILMRTYESEIPAAILEYAYKHADDSGVPVVIYRRVVSDGDSLLTVQQYEYIATGVESDTPEGAQILTSIGPRSSLFDRYDYQQGECC
jgi:hypothetical protein